MISVDVAEPKAMNHLGGIVIVDPVFKVLVVKEKDDRIGIV